MLLAMSRRSVRVVVMTQGGDYAERVLAGLALADVPADAVLLVEPAAPRQPTGSLVARARGHGLAGSARIGGALVRERVRGLRRPGTRSAGPERFEGLADAVVDGGPLNGRGMLDALADLRPDYVLLAGVGIVGAEALAVPRRGTLNAHPGLLPWLPGLGVVERAIERGVAVGVTTHFVDAGIDTGPIVRRELVPVHPGDTVGSLRIKAYALAARTLVDLMVAAHGGDHPAGVPQTGRFDYCRWPSDDERARLDEAVRGGRALQLHDAWASFYGGRVLPAEVHETPIGAPL